MIQKKSPRGLAAVGAGKKGGKVVNLACPHSATPALPAQGESCDRCQFFRIVALASGHDRKLCMMTGEKLRTAAGWCDLFAPGKWEELRPLTRALALGMVKAPNTVRRNRRLYRAPHDEKSGLFCFCQHNATGASCGGYILAERRPVSARTGGLTVAGERRFAFFYAFKTPKHSRCFMHSIPLFRPASCGGRASLSFLLRKLARAGETAALVALLGTSLSTSARVRWAMLGHVLTVVEVRHA